MKTSVCLKALESTWRQKMLEVITDELKLLNKNGLYRELTPPCGIDFCSNDYLGLSQSPFLQESLIQFIFENRHMWNSSSRLISGSTDEHFKTEEFIAEYFNRSAVIFSSGYNANLGVIESLCKNANIFSDELNHASLIDGIKNTGSQKFIYKHRDFEHLESLLKRAEDTLPRFIITESVFSMEGTIAPLPEIISLSKQYGAFLIVDEAHATGVFGQGGRGILADLNFDSERTLSIHTCGKALGSFGAFILCSPNMKGYLINKCRHFIYTTALPPLQVFQIRKSIQHIQSNPDLVSQLWKNIKFLNSKIHRELQSSSPIYSIQLGGNQEVCKLEEKFRQEGLAIKAIRWPTVPKGTERLRVSIHSNHTEQDLNRLLGYLESQSPGHWV